MLMSRQSGLWLETGSVMSPAPGARALVCAPCNEPFVQLTAASLCEHGTATTRQRSVPTQTIDCHRPLCHWCSSVLPVLLLLVFGRLFAAICHLSCELPLDLDFLIWIACPIVGHYGAQPAHTRKECSLQTSTWQSVSIGSAVTAVPPPNQCSLGQWWLCMCQPIAVPSMRAY